MADNDEKKTPAVRFGEVMEAIKALDAEGVRDAEAGKRMAELITEGKALRSQLEQSKEAGDLGEWASRSTGMPTLAPAGPAGTGATVESMRPTGRDEGVPAALRIAQTYKEGQYEDKFRGIIGSNSYQDAFRSYIRTLPGNMTDPAAIRTLQEGADGSGGFLVPEDILDRVIAREPTPTRLAGRVTQLQTGRDAIVVPKVNYTADDIYSTGMRVTWTGEIPASSTAMRVTDPVFGQVRIPVFTAMMSIPLTNDMIEDTVFPLVNWLSGKFGETIDLLRDNMILNGTGQGQPTGILLSPGADSNQPKVTVSGAAAAFTAAGLIKTAMSLPEQYDTNAVWVMNKVSSGNAIANLVDTTGRPIWGTGIDDAGLQNGYLNRPLVGYPVVFSGFAPNVAASAYPAVFGDLSGYYLVNRIGFSVQVLRELYAETNQVLVLGRIRFGGALAEPWKTFVHQLHT